MGGFAWVTLATNDSYSLGALVLAHSLKEVGTSQKLAVLITPGVTSSMREKLASVFDIVQEVNILDSKDEANLRLLKRPELGVTFTKLHCWRLTQFDKCVFLDADTLVLENCDELFLREELSAAPDVGWPDCFNSGVFVYQPSNDTYEKLVQFALDKGSFDGGDQGLLNLYFSDWSYKDISKHLPFIYNMSSAATYSYLPAFKQFGGNAKIIHFIGSTKPWLQYFNTETKQVQPSDDLKHIQSLLQHWWNIFCTFIHPTLSPDMTRGSDVIMHINPSHLLPNHPPQINQLSNEPIDDWDPWEEYVSKSQSSIISEYHKHEPLLIQETKPIESHNTNAFISGGDAGFHYVPEPSSPSPYHQHHEPEPIVHHQSHSEPIIQHDHHQPEPTIDHHQPEPTIHHHHPEPTIHHHHHQPEPSNYHDHHDHQPEPVVITDHYHNVEPPIVINHQQHTSEPISQVPRIESESDLDANSSSSSFTITSQLVNDPINSDISKKKSTLTHPVPPNDYEANVTVSKEITLHTPTNNEDSVDTGIAGAFAQLTLGTARTAEQIALDDHLRRQGWEVGNIDYLGRDSFDNIWSKICQTLSASPASPPPPPPAQQQSSPVIPPPQPPTPKLKESTPPQSEVLSVVKSPAEVINSQVKETTKETVVEAPKPDPIAIETTKPQTPTESQPKQTTIDTPPAAITSEAPQPPKSSEKPAEITPKQSDKPPAATSTITEDLPKTVSAEISKTLAQTAAIQNTKSSVPSESSTKQTTDKSALVETLTKPPTEVSKIPVEVPVETTPKASSEIPKPPTETPKIPARAAKTSAETSKPIAKPPTEIPAPPGEAPKVPSQSVKTSKPAPVKAPPAETAAVCKKPSVEIPKTTVAKESPDSPKTPQSPKPQTPTKSAPGGGLEGAKSSESKKSKAPKTPDAVDSTVEQLSVDTTVLDTPPPPGDEASGTPTAPKRTVKKTKPKQK